MKKVKLFLFSLFLVATTQSQTLSYKHSNAGKGYSNVTAEVNGYITSSQQTVVADFASNIVDYNNNWTSNADYDYYVNNTFVASSTSQTLSVDLTAYIPVTSVKIVSKASNWSSVAVTLTVTPSVALVSGPSTASSISYYKYTVAPPLSATLTGDGVSLKWYTSSLGEGYSATAPTPSTGTVGTTTYYVAQANSSGVESERVMITVIINPALAPDISYATPQLYTVGTSIPNLVPTNIGGAVPGDNTYNFSISPALPSGLTINPTTGIISGTPTQTTVVTNYTITAANEGGSNSAIVNIRVKAQAPNISYSTPKLYTVGTAIANLTPTNTGGAVPGTSIYIYSVSPSLPNGLAINTTTGAITGTPTAVQAATDYSITASNESGSSSATVTIRVKEQAPNISYASPHVYTKGATISSLMPTNTGGSVPGTSTYIYTVNPTLPSGLTLNAVTGEILGTPTHASAPTNYSITASNESGSSSATVNIKVTSLEPYISYATPQVYLVETAIPNLAPTNVGGAVPTSGSSVSTFAGGSSGNQDGMGTAASFSYPYGVATDAADNVYVADQYNHSIRKITPDGNVTTLAGNGIAISVDGAGTAAGFNTPMGVAVDADGNVFVADQYSSKIRKITPDGVTTTIAGSGLQGMDDGIGETASFSQPIGVAFTHDGSTLYVADFINYAIRKITDGNVVTTLAGGTQGDADGTGTAASFDVTGLAVDAAGNVFVADQFNSKIRKITPAGVVTTFAGSGQTGAADGLGTAASFNAPTCLAIDSGGNLYVTDQYNYTIRKITPAGLVSTIAGDGTDGFVNGLGLAASFSGSAGIAVDSKGNLYVADAFNQAIRKISLLGYTIKPALPAGLIFNAGTGEISGTPTELREAMDYTITATNEYGSHSTVISLSTEGPNNVNEVSKNAVRIYTVEGNKIMISGIENAQVHVYNQVGQQVYNAKVNGIIDHVFAKGMYIVRVGNTVGKVLVK